MFDLFVRCCLIAHAELHWLLACDSPLGRLQRMTQFKDKSRKKGVHDAPLALLAYPVLMAADILLFDATHVPVGDDQTQHLELTAALARAFNSQHKAHDLFRVPQAMSSAHGGGARVMSLTEPVEFFVFL